MTIKLVTDTGGFDEIRTWIDEFTEPVLCIDTETIGLQPSHQNQVRLLQVGSPSRAWVVPWDAEKCREILEHIKAARIRITFHNALFDLGVLTEALGVDPDWWPWERIDDTLLAFKSQDPFSPAGLEELTERFVQSGAKGAQKKLKEEMRRGRWTFENVPITLAAYWQYAGVDVISGSRLWSYMETRGWFTGSEYVEIEQPMLRVASWMSHRGFKVDHDYCRERISEHQRGMDASASMIRNGWGIDPASNKEVGEKFQTLGVKLPKTKTGKPSVDKNAMQTTMNDEADSLRHYLLEYRHHSKLINTYYQNFVGLSDAEGYLHPRMNTCQAKTFRTSMNSPNLQNVPKRNEEVRRAFRPSTGNVLVTCDWDQLQMRIMAVMSHDVEMRKSFESDEDFFCNVASTLYNKPVGKEDFERQLAKSFGYATIFGAGVSKAAKTAGVRYSKMKNIQQRWNEKFTGVASWSAEVVRNAKRQAIAGSDPKGVSLRGRTVIAKQTEPYALVCYAIQGSEAEIAKQTLNNVQASWLGEYLISFVHDEIILDVPREAAEEAARDIENIMTWKNYEVPFTASSKIMDRWGE